MHFSKSLYYHTSYCITSNTCSRCLWPLKKQQQKQQKNKIYLLTSEVCFCEVLQRVWKGDSQWQYGKMSHQCSTSQRSLHRTSGEVYATLRVHTCLDATQKHTQKHMLLVVVSLNSSIRFFIFYAYLISGIFCHLATRRRPSLQKQCIGIVWPDFFLSIQFRFKAHQIFLSPVDGHKLLIILQLSCCSKVCQFVNRPAVLSHLTHDVARLDVSVNHSVLT